MRVDIEDVMFWMDAIRESDDRYRTLESFWKGQVRSKVWLISELSKVINSPVSIIIHAGWNGVLSSLLFNSNIPIKRIISLDIDPICRETAATMNKIQEMAGKFQSKTADMCEYVYDINPDVVINTSCEHVTDEQLQHWFNQIPDGAWCVMQSNNFFNLDEHVNCVKSAEELAQKFNLTNFKTYELETPEYTRFMIIAKK